ncbi:MAG TPA: hypothetical protein VIK06_06355 [Candidatus Limnocylindrales bacterium]
MATVPVLVTVTVAVKPFAHWLSTCMLAEHLTPPEPDGVAEALRLGDGLGEGDPQLVQTGVGVTRLGEGVGIGEGVVLEQPPVQVGLEDGGRLGDGVMQPRSHLGVTPFDTISRPPSADRRPIARGRARQSSRAVSRGRC